MARTARSKSWPDAKKSDAVDADFRRLETRVLCWAPGVRGQPGRGLFRRPGNGPRRMHGVCRRLRLRGWLGLRRAVGVDWRIRRSKLNRADEKRPSRGAMPRKAARPRVSRRRESRSGIGRRGGGNGRVGRACKFDPLSFAEGPTHDLGVVFSCPDRTFAKIGSERWQPKNSERTALI